MPKEGYQRPYLLENGWDQIDTFSTGPYSHRNRTHDYQFDIEHTLPALDDSLDYI